jgi:translation initiation factor eIF-2B subunit delta
MFAHLRQHTTESSLSQKVTFGSNSEIHPLVIRLALQFADGLIVGGNARCAALLTTFKVIIQDFTPARLKPFAWELDHYLKNCFNVISTFRSHCASMGYAMKFVRTSISTLIKNDMTEENAKNMMIESIDSFYHTRIQVASESIAERTAEIIESNHTILTYGRSFSVEQGLLLAHKYGKRFKVIVVDSRPHLEGKHLLRELARAGIEVTYVLLNAVSYVMGEVTTVIMGASSMMSNGAAYSRVGTACVAAMAKWYNKPVIFCCETYKFSEKVNLDSICTNELGNPNSLVDDSSPSSAPLKDWTTKENLKLLNLRYDTTPVSDVTMIITEVAYIPPSAVPVIVREEKKEEKRD